MHIPTFIVYDSKKPLQKAQIRKRLDSVKEFANLGGELKQWKSIESCGERTGVAFWNIVSSHLYVPLHYQADDGYGFAMHLPIGITRISCRSNIKNGKYIFDLFDAAKKDVSTITEMAPPAIFVQCRRNTGCIEILNDALGFGRLYKFECRDITIWTNRLALAPIFAAQVPQIDIDAWSTLATGGWFMGDRTAYKNASVVPGGTRTIIKCDGGHTVRQAPLKSLRLSSGSGLTSSAIDDVADSLDSCFSEINEFTDVPLRFGLSGGRDSRLVSAFGIGRDSNLKLFTKFPPQAEADIAQQLIDAVPGKPDWSLLDRNASPVVSVGTQNLGVLAKAWNHIYDADMFPSVLFGTPPMDRQRPMNLITLSGAAGEVAHPNFYTPEMVARFSAEKRLESFKKGFFRSTPLVLDSAKRVAEEEFEAVMRVASELNIEGYHRLDVFYILSRLRRWAGGNWSIDVLLPLLSPKFMEVGFGQTLEEKFQSELHRRLIKRVAPYWADVPFFHEIRHTLPVEERSTGARAPNFWMLGQEGELLETLRSHDQLWECFDKNAMIHAFSDISSIAPERHLRMQLMAQRALWMAGFIDHLQDVTEAVSVSKVT